MTRTINLALFVLGAAVGFLAALAAVGIVAMSREGVK